MPIRIIILLMLALTACKTTNPEEPPTTFQIISVEINSKKLDAASQTTDVNIKGPIILSFTTALDTASVKASIELFKNENESILYQPEYEDSNSKLSLILENDLDYAQDYSFSINNQLKGAKGEAFNGIGYNFTTKNGVVELDSLTLNGDPFTTNQLIQNIDFNVEIIAYFSEPLNEENLSEQFKLFGSGDTELIMAIDATKKIITLQNKTPLAYLKEFTFSIKNTLTSNLGYEFEGFSNTFFTKPNDIPLFPTLSENDLLTKIEEQTFKYFWDFAHPVSGLTRERNTSGETVTIGGSGFGLMAIIVAIERGFITRQEGIDRIETIVNFLKNADRFHGVWPHWMNGSTGAVIPFSSDDDGGDLVETAFMIQGLLTVRQYLNSGNSQEAEIVASITQLWEEVEWDWYTQGGQDVLYWHWSPNFEWQKNHKIQGWNEALIIYVLAAASPTHPIDASVYHKGWAKDGAMANGNDFFSINLPLGTDFGGPLFFSHYSFLGLDPRNLEDQYANYWVQNTNHTLINRAYCIDNPKNYISYNSSYWGLTASDNHEGYSAHSPTNDKGVITPTAAISSIPYTPQQSMEAINNFYYYMGDRLWGEYGFYDAFNVTENWYASSYLAIDQGPIILMIENHRTGLLWDLFMNDTEITDGLDKLGFTSY